MPIGVPSRRPRTVSITGVNGWFWANQASGPGIESVGTKPLLRNGRRIRKIGRLLAVSTLLATMPSATDSHEMANAVSASRPAAASHSSGPVVGRKPISTATIMTMASASIVWITLPTTWPASTDARAMSIVRNRAKMPSFMSMATEIAVPWAAPATVISSMPGNDVGEVFGATAGHPAETGPQRPAEDVHEQEQEDDRESRR